MSEFYKKIIFAIGALIISTGIFAIYYFCFSPNIGQRKLTALYNKAAEIKAKYLLDGFSLIMPAKDKNSVGVEIGDKTKKELTPDITFQRWENEVSFTIKPSLSGIDDNKVSFVEDKIKFDTPKAEYNLYDLKDGYEYELILKEKPATNVVSFNIETQGLDFFYQPPLTQEEKDKGMIRPENVVGSYAVYAQENKINYVGRNNYHFGCPLVSRIRSCYGYYYPESSSFCNQ